MIRERLKAVASLPIALVVWWGGASLIRNSLLPSPWMVAKAWGNLLSNGVLFESICLSLARVLTGVGIAVGLALMVTFASVFIKHVERILLPIVEVLRPISPIAWTPIAILAFQTGDRASVFIVTIGAFFPILLSFMSGLKSVGPEAIETARAFGASTWLTLTDVYLPATKNSLVTGIRIGLGSGWMTVIAAEMVGVQSGLGYLIQANRFLLRMDNVVAIMLTIGSIGFGINWLIQVYARESMPWLTR